jgi:hypothetical protein
MWKNITEIDKAYISGFLDGDGSIIVQIVKDDTRKFKFYIRISVVFFQKSVYHWFILWLKDIFSPHGYITKRPCGMSEFVIVAQTPVETILKELYPYLKIKKPLCRLVLSIIQDLKAVKTEADFLKVCIKVDETAKYTYSKPRKIDSTYVRQYLNLPVETFGEAPKD